MEQIIEGGIYKHYKKGDLYKVVKIAYHHEDGDDLKIVLYSRCDENGIFISIRLNTPSFNNDDNQAIIVGQPFWRLYDEFISDVKVGEAGKIKMVKRFEYVKQAHL